MLSLLYHLIALKVTFLQKTHPAQSTFVSQQDKKYLEVKLIFFFFLIFISLKSCTLFLVYYSLEQPVPFGLNTLGQLFFSRF